MNVEYIEDGDIAVFDGYSFRRDKKTGYYLSARPIAGRRKRLHVYVWEYFNGAIPKGYHVHHKVHDKRLNDIEDLELLEQGEHIRHHLRTLTDEQKEKRSDNIINKAIPASKAWHASVEGHEWHVQHGKEVIRNLKPAVYVCTYCGEMYETKNRYSAKSNTFCSNKCRAAYRRKMGYDDIEKVCSSCGATYKANKYQKTKYCKSCRDRVRGRKTGCVQS